MTTDDPSTPARARAAARRRATWPMRITSLDAAVDDDGFVDAPPGERVAMVYELTLAAWALSGRPMPTYSRAEIPGRLIRGDSSP